MPSGGRWGWGCAGLLWMRLGKAVPFSDTELRLGFKFVHLWLPYCFQHGCHSGTKGNRINFLLPSHKRRIAGD